MLELQREIDALKDTAPVPETFARDFQVSTVFHPLPAEFLQAVVKESLKVPVHVWRETMATHNTGNAPSASRRTCKRLLTNLSRKGAKVRKER